jgi:hypothetical protein
MANVRSRASACPWRGPTAVAALIDDHLTGRRDRRKALWTLFTFERWLGRWGDGTT